MPNHKSAAKRIKTSEKQRQANKSARSAIRTSIKKIRTAATKDEAQVELPKLFSMLDKAAARNRGNIKSNTAANYKSKAAKVAAAKPA